MPDTPQSEAFRRALEAFGSLTALSHWLKVPTDVTQRYGTARPILIAVTARGSESDRRAAELCGFHHHIPKPYDPEKLLGLLASLHRRP